MFTAANSLATAVEFFFLYIGKKTDREKGKSNEKKRKEAVDIQARDDLVVETVEARSISAVRPAASGSRDHRTRFPPI